ncbi:very short patch repair endonuclease [uncultured Pseudomonas sp.]|uniref:very short patch repair endonuclease n=1 Tax=uncultured Pseudomonas sp. TaxID=114707 RepID=UPI0030D70E9D|tara:strand:+ start:979 stop:1449 length:471 start_codon:yes stop_codon:yes gene_type:complete
MTDVVDSSTRSRMMSGIRGKDTAPELAVRRYLHAMGYRFRLHEKNLPGSPDLVLKKHNLVIFVHGCFWHRHPDCFYATSPATRREFWQNKLTRNAQRDEEQRLLLAGLGWRVLVVWECGIKHAADKMGEITDFIVSDEIRGHWPLAPPRIRASRRD